MIFPKGEQFWPVGQISPMNTMDAADGISVQRKLARLRFDRACRAGNDDDNEQHTNRRAGRQSDSTAFSLASVSGAAHAGQSGQWG